MPENEPSPVSELYEPSLQNQIIDEPISSKYHEGDYAIGYEVGPDGLPVPENGNTAVFRIRPHGFTEPVYVTKPEDEATFTVTVLEGQGQMIKADEAGNVIVVELIKGDQAVIRPGEAYSYSNTSDEADLLLHDVAMPAYGAGDDVDINLSQTPDQPPQPKPGYSVVVARTNDGHLLNVELPQRFFDLMAKAALRR